MKRRLATLALLVLLPLAGLTWLAGTGSGLRALTGLASTASGGRLQFAGVDGRLAGPLQIAEVQWQDGEQHITISQLQLAWSPAALSDGRLQVDALTIGELRIDSPAQQTPTPAPADLRLPLALAVDRLEIAAVHYNGSALANDLHARLASDGRQHRLVALSLRSGDVVIAGDGEIDGLAPFTLRADLAVHGQLAERPLALDLHAAGPLAQLPLRLQAKSGIAGDGEVLLTPFAAQPFASARIDLSDIDPAAWQAALPSARLAARIDIAPTGDGVSARFQISNSRPGPLDRQALPFTELAGAATWQAGRLQLPALRLTLAGGGELQGRGDWQGEQDGSLHLELTASRLDAGRLLAALRPTRLAGTIKAELGANAQQVRVDLADPRFRLRAAVEHAAATVRVEQLELAAGDARLQASGKLHTGDLSFSADARLDRFDPARFAALPAATLNATLQASGRLGSKPVVDGEFALRDSRFRDQPVSGQGKLRLAWPLLSDVDLQLALAGNRLQANGAFGRADDRLSVVIDAPQLAALGGEGGIAGRLELGGTLERPSLSASLQAATLGLPGSFRLRGLKLDSQLGADDDAALKLQLGVDEIGDGHSMNWAQALQLTVDGSRRSHRLRLTGKLSGGERLQLAASGGLSEMRWQGQLDELTVNAHDAARNLRLLAPAAVRLAGDGWSLGPLRLAGTPLDWQATLAASADASRLQAELQASGSRVGKVDAQLEATLASPWQLATDRPWQGRFDAAINDLAWLGELLGEQWRSAGELKAALRLAGTPGRPQLAGTVHGSRLAVSDTESGMRLEQGELAAEIADNRLQLRRFVFVSPHQPLPRPLRQRLGDAAAAQSAPGKLEVTGSIAIDPASSDGHANLDVVLDRVGVRQRPDQWLNLSGQGKLSWQQAALGLRGQLAVDAAWWQMAPAGAPRLSDDVIVQRPGQKTTASPRARLDLDLEIGLGRHFLFDGSGLSTRLAGSLRLTASGRDLPRASGTIRTRDGRFDAYGQQLEIERGELRFQGLPENPALDVRAVRKGLSVEAGVQISGTAQKPVLRLVSDPELPDAEKLSWLVLGHGPEGTGSGDASVLLAAAAGLLGNDSGKLVQQLKRSFGIDEFGVRQGSLDGSGRQAGSRIAGGSVDTTTSTGQQIFSIGKRLTETATLGYEQSLGTADSIVRLSVALTRDITLIGRAGSDNAVDVFYTLTWGLPPSRRGRREAAP